jgi:hypothetical protein
LETNITYITQHDDEFIYNLYLIIVNLTKNRKNNCNLPVIKFRPNTAGGEGRVVEELEILSAAI